jgi:phage baseplate assembly protein gpV
MLDIARVVETRPESHAVDLEFMADGRRLSGVQVMSRSAGTDMGLSDLSQPAQTGYGALNTAVRDVYAVVGYFGQTPVVLGFLFPQVAQCLFPDRDRMVYRHASDVYMTIDAAGNTEVCHPSGTYLRIGTSPAHEDLTGRDYDKLWKIRRNTDKAVHVHLSVKNGGAEVASINVDPTGNVTESNVGALSASVGGAASVTSGGAMTLTAPTITLNGQTTINGSLTQGTGAAGGGCTMLGPVSVTNDVVAGGVSLMNHTHPGDSGGTTGAPN